MESKERWSPRERGVFFGAREIEEIGPHKFGIRRWGIHTKGNEEFSTKKVLSEPNVKVVFHQTAVHVTPLSAWIIYPKGSALGHSTRCLAEVWSSSVDSLFCSRCRTCCSVGGRSSYMDPFLYVVASAFPGRAVISSYPEGPSAFFEKQIDISISQSVFLTPPHPPPFVEPFL